MANCVVCGAPVSEYNRRINRHTQNVYCSCCYNERGIRYYHEHHGDFPRFFGGRGPFLGIELEVDKGGEDNDHARTVQEILGFDRIYCETDGSISDGFENITEPMTFEYHKSIREKYEEMFRYLVSNRYRSHNTGSCGLHIHVNRDFFMHEDKGIETVLFFVDKFWDELVRFSRRPVSEIDRWAAKYEDSPREIVEHTMDYGRYHAVNLCNADTIEFRIFKGTLNPDTFFATLELVNNIVRIANKVANGLCDRDSVRFEDFLESDCAKEYWNRRLGA